MRFNAKFMTKTALVAAVYVVVTLLCYPFAFGPVQFRFSEIMVLLAFVEPLYIPGLLLGCFVSNLLGTGGMMDALFGTFASAVSLLMVYWSARWFRNQTLGLVVASLWSSVFSFIIAFGMTFMLGDPASFWFWTGMVALGEFCVITVVGVPLFRFLLSKPGMVKLIKKIRS